MNEWMIEMYTFATVNHKLIESTFLDIYVFFQYVISQPLVWIQNFSRLIYLFLRQFRKQNVNGLNIFKNWYIHESDRYINVRPSILNTDCRFNLNFVIIATYSNTSTNILLKISHFLIVGNGYYVWFFQSHN